MKMLSAWDISSKGLIFSKIFDESEQDLELQKKALANILVTQEFDMMPVVKKSAKTIGSQTTPGPIEGVAILDDSKANVDIINYEDCPSIPRDTNFVSAIITLLKSKNRFVFVGESTSKAEAIITSSMLTSPDISDALIFLSATTAMEGGISEDASFGLRVYEQILSSLKEETISESCLNNLISLDPKKKVSGVIDSEVTYVPKGGVTAQHIMKFPLAGVTKTIEREYSGLDCLRRPEVDYEQLTSLACFAPAVSDPLVSQQVEIQAKYQGYIERQQREIDKCQKQERVVIPETFDYAPISGLSAEITQKLQEMKPQTIGQASRIPGVTPAAISLLLVYLKKHQVTASDKV